ncbi:hypothetical protein BYT27DRAFT_7241462 [Phlegmacium glaucopus]|nr:hypothetical protein BYT27DRAFT_7241462 [Phlegmacium glaucopus]
MSVINSTPYKVGTKNKSQAGNLDNRIKQVESDFDRLLDHFIYLIIDEEDDKNKTLNNLQSQIEELQERRYYPQAQAEAKVADGVEAGDEELGMVRQREVILSGCRDKSLREVLDIANDGHLKDALKSYCLKEGNESNRYGKYVSLCNLALEELKDVDLEGLRIRKPSPLDLCFQRSDTKHLQSQYDGGEVNVIQIPDVVATSRVAALHVAQQGKFSLPPKTSLSWCQSLMAHEFKFIENDLTRKFDDTAKANFMSITRAETIEQSILEDSYATPVVISDEELESHGKCKFSTDHGEGPASKMPRFSNQQSTPGKCSALKTSILGKSISVHSESNLMGTSNSEKAVSHRVQLATYALEMMSYSLGVHHAINLLIIDDMLWVWYYDRQGIVQSDGISIVADFPRFLLLLLVFQRFTLEDWGVIPSLNPDSVNAHEGDPALRVVSKSRPITDLDPTTLDNAHLQDKNIKSVRLQLEEFLSHESHCLAGRATAVIAASAAKDGDTEIEMVCKIYHPEVQRRHEGKTLEVVHHIADEEDPNMKKHLPTMFFYGDVPGCFKKLEEITEYSGIDFVNAWLEVVACHAFLWKYRVEHGDPSLGNTMYDPDLKCGVLTDFDLSIFQWEPSVIGTDPTGTIPFMATDLLTEAYWQGLIKRLYRHELEAFIWILPYTFLLYDDGVRSRNKYIDPWRTSDYNACIKEKLNFQQRNLAAAATTVQNGFKEFWPLVQLLFRALRQSWVSQTDRFDAPLLPTDPENDQGNRGDDIGAGLESKEMWDFFISALDIYTQRIAIQHRSNFCTLVTRLKMHLPDFVEMTEEEATLLREKYGLFLRHPSST